MTQKYDRPAYSTRIREMPTGDRPRERLLSLGAKQLSDTELVAILLRTGVKGEGVMNLASRLLSEFGGLSKLSRASVSEMSRLRGISDVKAVHILAALEIGRRAGIRDPEERPIVGNPEEVYNHLCVDMAQLAQENLRVVLLNTKNVVLGMRTVYQGTVNSAAVRVAEVLRPAIRENCPAIIVVHNHPSGDPTPSPEDILVTRRVRRGAEEMDIELLDHLVIGDRGFVSMKRRDLGF